jgi:hypothetical protein
MDLKVFRLEHVRQGFGAADELALVHTVCGQIVKISLLSDNFSLQHWVSYAKAHRCGIE